MASSPEFRYSPVFPLASDTKTEYRKLDIGGVSTAEFEGKRILKIAPEALTELAKIAFHETAHFLRAAHLKQVRAILDDPEASENDRFVAFEFLKNAVIAAEEVFPSCQDTGTAIVYGKKGQRVMVAGHDEEALSRGIFETYTKTNLRYSQLAPLSMFEEKNTGNNLPAQFDLLAAPGEEHADEYHFLFIAKGGGSANKSFLYQETRALLTPETLFKFIKEKITTLGTAACPPYHLAVVIGGTSAEANMKTAKLASTHYLDELPTKGDLSAHAFRDTEAEKEILKIAQNLGIGAQFGGKYFCHDVRVIRLPRHGASLPVSIAVSCSADRQVKGKITAEGIFLEKLEHEPVKFLPVINEEKLSPNVVKIDLNRPMPEILKKLSQYPVKTRVSLTGTLIVARDIAHAKLKERLDRGEGLPDYFKNHPVYYAGPAKTPEGYASGSFGPTTAGRMDSYVPLFQKEGGSMIMLAKGNRSAIVKESCKRYGGFYLGSIGGPAAVLGRTCIKKIEVLEFPELGMEAVWKIEVEDFPAFIITDDKGNDFFSEISH